MGEDEAFRSSVVSLHGSRFCFFTDRDIVAVDPEDTETIIVESSFLHEKAVFVLFSLSTRSGRDERILQTAVTFHGWLTGAGNSRHRWRTPVVSR